MALKKINILQRETRAQLLNDVKALCDAPGAPGLIAFHGACVCVCAGRSVQQCVQCVQRAPPRCSALFWEERGLPLARCSTITHRPLSHHAPPCAFPLD